MPRPTKWEKGKHQVFKLKLTNDKAEAYKRVLKSKIPPRDMQADFEIHVEKTITN